MNASHKLSEVGTGDDPNDNLEDEALAIDALSCASNWHCIRSCVTQSDSMGLLTDCNS